MGEFRGECYRDDEGDWRWRVLAENGKIVADSSEGYENKGDCLAMYAQLHPQVKIAFPSSEEPSSAP